MPTNRTTTKKEPFYNAHSKTVIHNQFRMWYGGIFVIRSNVFCFYIANSKTVVHNRLRMVVHAIFVIMGNLNKDGFVEGPSSFK